MITAALINANTHSASYIKLQVDRYNTRKKSAPKVARESNTSLAINRDKIVRKLPFYLPTTDTRKQLVYTPRATA